MSILTLLYYPDARLLTLAKPVTQFDAALQTLIDNMIETMHEHDGAGLAATQVNRHKRLLLTNAKGGRENVRVFINPEILSYSDQKKTEPEGCLSLPNLFVPIARSLEINIKYQDQQGNFQESIETGLEAKCIQHELDHINGMTLMDHLSPLKRMRAEKKLAKNKKRVL
jgi:peptide deformylase